MWAQRFQFHLTNKGRVYIEGLNKIQTRKKKKRSAKSRWNRSDRSFLLNCDIYLSVTNLQNKKCRAGAWFYALVVDLILRRGRCNLKVEGDECEVAGTVRFSNHLQELSNWRSTFYFLKIKRAWMNCSQ